ncbi:MAG: molybdenum cofactor guanylyltransferase [bacterium]
MTGVILAGGQSRRMGTDKALVDFQGKPMIQWVVDALSKVCDPVLIVTNSPSLYCFLGLEMVGDLFPGRGALAGIHAGLFFSRGEKAFVAGCDMPLICPELIHHMAQVPGSWDVLVPKVGEYLEPLHALYSRRCLSFLERLLVSGASRILDLYPLVRVRVFQEQETRKLDPQLRSLLNVNTPEDLTKLNSLRSQTSPVSSG